MRHKKISLVHAILFMCSISLTTAAYSGSATPESSTQEPTAMQSPTEQYPELSNAVSIYMAAWEKQEFDKMEPYEDFTGGEDLTGFYYMQAFDVGFGLSEWKISKIQPEENGEFLVLVMIKHNPPKSVAQFIPQGQKVRGTLRQYWKKDGDRYVHLFHIEKQRLLSPMFNKKPMTQPVPDPQQETTPPETTDATKENI